LYNATGLSLPFGDLLASCKRATGSDARFVWVPSERLLAAGVGEWMELPLWLASAEYAAMQRVDVSRAVAAGLTFRPPAETIRDTLAWDAGRGEDEPRSDAAGLAPGRERELLAGA
jgi:2'-hydroxyisoflavone reductase